LEYFLLGVTLGFGSGIISGPRWAMVLKSTDRVSILLSGMDRFREAGRRLYFVSFPQADDDNLGE
jgi:hypothetical protein